MSSGNEVEGPIDEPVLRSDVTAPHPPNLAVPNPVHCFVTMNRPPRTTELPKMLLGTDPFLDGAVILMAAGGRKTPSSFDSRIAGRSSAR
jgi:hypothetical protein